MVPTGERGLEPVGRGHHSVRTIGATCVADRSDGDRVEVGQIACGDDDVATNVEQCRDHAAQRAFAGPPILDERVRLVVG